MPRWLYGLLVFGFLAVVGRLLGAPPVLVFAAACLGLVPLAGLIGHATGQVALHLGAQYGGLLNATFGNAAELIITLLALRQGFFTLVKASITGSIVGNTLLVLGLALLAGGIRHGLLKFDMRLASLNAALMILAVAGLLLPALFSTLVPDSARVEELSILVAVVLLLSYGAYLVFVLRGTGPFLKNRDGSSELAAPWFAKAEGEDEVVSESAEWSVRRLLTLASATVGTAIVSEVLVDAVEPVTLQFGWTELFVGVILIPIVGNAAENWAAVRAAWRNHVDLTLGITAGSSTQIPLFVAPVLIFASLPMGRPMTLVFEPLELMVLALSTAIFAYVSLDGESHWLEGVLLLALYLMTAAVFFLDPVGTSVGAVELCHNDNGRLQPTVLAALRAVLFSLALVASSLAPPVHAQDTPGLDGVQAVYTDLLELFYRPLEPSDLLQAGWTALSADAQRHGVPAHPDPLPELPHADKDAAFQSFAGAYGKYVASLPPTYPPAMAAAVVQGGMADSLHEQHTHFLSQAIMQRFLSTVSGGQQGVGLGVLIGGDPPGLITRVAPDGPGASAGLQEGDVIVGADGKDLSTADAPTLGTALSGPQGAAISLSIDRGSGPQTVDVTRGAYYFPPLESRMLPDGVGYLRLSDFVISGTTLPNGTELLSDLDRRLDDLDAQGAQALVLDLRGNGGGSVQTSDELLGRFLPDTTRSVHESDRRGHDTYELASGRLRARQLPMAVMINGGSASASEITAAALRDAHRAVLVGQRTAGAVASSELLPLPGGGALQIAVAAADAGESTAQLDGVGITPDVATSLPRTLADYRSGPTRSWTSPCPRWPLRRRRYRRAPFCWRSAQPTSTACSRPPCRPRVICRPTIAFWPATSGNAWTSFIPTSSSIRTAARRIHLPCSRQCGRAAIRAASLPRTAASRLICPR